MERFLAPSHDLNEFAVWALDPMRVPLPLMNGHLVLSWITTIACSADGSLPYAVQGSEIVVDVFNSDVGLIKASTTVVQMRCSLTSIYLQGNSRGGYSEKDSILGHARCL
jgi:hypothetical protein